MTAEPDLLPCPGCGGDSTRVIGGPGTRGGPQYWAGCDVCRWRTWGNTEAEAIATWNTRANVAHATAARDAEVEALRAEVEGWKSSYARLYVHAESSYQARKEAEAQAERLAEALRGLLDVEDKFTGDPEEDAATWVAANDAARAALEQESGKGVEE